MSQREKIYIASDLHLGLDLELSSLSREQMFVDWLDTIKYDAKKLILLGDTFDYWFEYKNCIPKGYSLFIAKLIELSKIGVELILFTGNHDMWLFDYFEKTIGAQIIRNPMKYTWGNKKIFIAHGDGLGPGDQLYKFIKTIFRNKICQWLFARIHPNLGLAIMKYFSTKSRESQIPAPFKKENERLIQFAEDYISKEDIDFFIFGHRHLPIKYKLSNNSSIYFNTGDWMRHFSYLEISNGQFKLKFFTQEKQNIYGN